VAIMKGGIAISKLLSFCNKKRKILEVDRSLWQIWKM